MKIIILFCISFVAISYAKPTYYSAITDNPHWTPNPVHIL